MIITTLEMALHCLWHWIGFTFILAIIVNIPIRIIRLILRHRTIRKVGYPPLHCNADGTIKEVKSKDADK